MTDSPASLPPRAVSDAATFGKVAVVYGGQSAEREVSLQSGAGVLAGLVSVGVDAHGVDAERDLIAKLLDLATDRVFIALHGPGGEDGTLQGALEYAGIPYTGTRVLGSALCMDKARTKDIWRANGLPTPPSMLLRNESDLAKVGEQVGFPAFIKPVHEGSSLGMTRVGHNGDLDAAFRRARAMDAEVIAERFVNGAEYTTAILGECVLPTIRLETHREFYDYEAKYSDDANTGYHCPCGLSSQRERELATLVMQAFRLVNGTGWGRVDLMCDSDGQPWLLEANTVPGMTSHSLVPMAASVAGMEFPELVWRILETSL